MALPSALLQSEEQHCEDLLCLVTTTEIGTGGATEEVEVAVAVVSAVATVSEAVAEATVSAAAAGASVAA